VSDLCRFWSAFVYFGMALVYLVLVVVASKVSKERSFWYVVWWLVVLWPLVLVVFGVLFLLEGR
jgi:hypothetical protein